MQYRDLPFKLGVLFGADYSTVTRIYSELFLYYRKKINKKWDSL